MTSNNVLVTGGAGYIGSHACKALKNAGYTPVTFDNLMTGWKEAVKFGPFIPGNLLNRNDIDAVFKLYSPIAVIHFAALSQVSESILKPQLYWENNVMGSLNLIQSAVDNNCLNFVFSSTCAIYGDQDNVVLDEDSIQNPINAYGASKRAVENILMDFEAAFNLKYVNFRYFNVAGADPDAEIGEFHRPETHLIPLILDAVIGKQEIIKIFGTDYDTFDGTCIRDYIHVCDLVDAHILGLKWLQTAKASNVYNLGTGNGFSVRQVIKTVKEVTNHEVPIIESSRRPGDATKLVSGSSRATRQLEWLPIRSNLKQIIEDAWRWHKKGFFRQ
jgi:UDP-glucose 4-epimerase